jgi:hypothetical protein
MGHDYRWIKDSIAKLADPGLTLAERLRNVDDEIKAHFEAMRTMPAKTPEDLAANEQAKAYLTELEQAREALTAEGLQPPRRA